MNDNYDQLCGGLRSPPLINLLLILSPLAHFALTWERGIEREGDTESEPLGDRVVVVYQLYRRVSGSHVVQLVRFIVEKRSFTFPSAPPASFSDCINLLK